MPPSGPSGRRVLIIGLDCAAPEFVFRHPDFHLPNLHQLMDSGAWGTLRSCDPPITVPAWSCMMSGRDPGELGVYGFRNRRAYGDYSTVSLGTSLSIKEKRLWDFVNDNGGEAVVLGVPQTFPAKPLRGCLVTGMLTPGADAECTHPAELRGELESVVGELRFDVGEYRVPEKDYLFKQILDLMENKFDSAVHLIRTKPWQLFAMVEIGMDRLHHAFWRYADEAHPKFEAESPYRWLVKQFYELVDTRIGELLQLAGPDTAVMVVSDHGAKAMHGGIRLNQWLIERGYLHLKEKLDAPRAFSTEDVDWSRTMAWGDGGYYGRIFLNIDGREPQGIVPPTEADAVATELAEALETMPGPDGSPLGNEVLRPNEVYRAVRGIAPDLLVYFGGLHWRSLGGVGEKAIFSETNDTGPDDANHAMDGIIIMNEGGGRRLEGASIYDVTPTALEWMDIPAPGDLRGRSLLEH